MPWHNTRAVKLNDHARRLVEEIEMEPGSTESIPDLEEVTAKLKDSDLNDVDDSNNIEESQETEERPQCILEYIRELEKEKMAKSILSNSESKEKVTEEYGPKIQPEELQFPLSERVEVWENFMSGNFNEELNGAAATTENCELKIDQSEPEN